MNLTPLNEHWKSLKVMDNLRLGYLEPAIRYDNYVHLLDMELALWMFVPCDKDGNVLEEPTQEEKEWCEKDSTMAEISYYLKEDKFKEAKQRVIFEEFELYDELGVVNEKMKENEEYIWFWDGGITLNLQEESIMLRTINDLTHLGLVLTQGAKEKYEL